MTKIKLSFYTILFVFGTALYFQGVYNEYNSINKITIGE